MTRWMGAADVTREIRQAAERTLRSGVPCPRPSQLDAEVKRIGYRPDPKRSVASWPECLARGYGACADAAALALASGMNYGLPVTLVYDEATCPDGAYHVVAVLGDGDVFDPFPLPTSCRSSGIRAVPVIY